MSIKTATINVPVNKTLTSDMIDKNATHLNLTVKSEIPAGVIHDTIDSITIELYCHKLKQGVLPTGLRYLVIKQYHHDIDVPLPSGLTHLYLYDDFTGKIMPGCIPDSLIALHVGNNIAHNINAESLPSSITRLILSGSMNAPVFLNTIVKNNMEKFAKVNCVDLTRFHLDDVTFPKNLVYLSLTRCAADNKVVIPEGVKYVSYENYRKLDLQLPSTAFRVTVNEGTPFDLSDPPAMVTSIITQNIVKNMKPGVEYTYLTTSTQVPSIPDGHTHTIVDDYKEIFTTTLYKAYIIKKASEDEIRRHKINSLLNIASKALTEAATLI